MEPPRRTDFHSLTQADKLIVAGGALKALAENDEIRAAMEPRGYDEAGRAVGQAILDAIRKATKKRDTTQTGRLVQTGTQDDAVEDADGLYRPLADTAETVFRKQTAVLTALGLTGEHSNARAARLARMRSFAEQASAPGLIDAFTKVGVSAKAFDDLLAALDAATDEAEDQDTGSAVAQDASSSRTGLFDDLDEWMLVMHGHARVVLADRPQLLEALGIRPR